VKEENERLMKEGSEDTEGGMEGDKQKEKEINGNEQGDRNGGLGQTFQKVTGKMGKVE